MFVTSKIFKKKTIHHPPSTDALEEGVFSPWSDKVVEASEHLINIMADDVWKIDELKERVTIFDYHLDLAILIGYLIEKKMIVVEEVASKNPHVKHRYYRVSEQTRK